LPICSTRGSLFSFIFKLAMLFYFRATRQAPIASLIAPSFVDPNIVVFASLLGL
jgi:hypothetical protein